MDLGGSPKMEGQKVTSRKYYEMELQKLNASLLEMGEMIRMAIGGAVTALLEFDHDKAREIIAYDEQIDRQNREIEQQCYTLLLSQQPVAGRSAYGFGGAENDDGHGADRRPRGGYFRNRADAGKSADAQLRADSPDGDGDERDAHQEPGSVCPARRRTRPNWVIGRDDVVDDLFDTVKSELIEAIRQNADNGEAATDLLMAAKYFERIGDHATNIAQWAIFSITGRNAEGLIS